MRDFDRIARKITTVLFLSQSLSSAGFIAAFTVNALIGVELTGQRAMAGVPGGLYVAGQACGAIVWGYGKDHQHALAAVSLVISAHTFGMFAFSVVSGRMTDRWGRGRVIIAGAAVMIVACVMAAPSIQLVPLTIALFVLGLGWNFAHVAGSALLADQLSPTERAKTQGFNDLVLSLSSGASQIGSGMIYARAAMPSWR
jgi:MFS family permease